MGAARADWRRPGDSALILLFIAMITLPVVRTVSGPKSTVLLSEQRTPSTFPELSLKSGSIRGFPTRFEAFFNDQFGFRDALIQLLSRAKVAWLGVSTSTKVTIGKDGWLYSSEFPDGSPSIAPRPFTADELRRWQRILENRRDWLAERGIQYWFVIAPNKESIYPEYLPKPCPLRATGSRLDQLVIHLRNQSSIQVIDLREPLLQAKKSERVFDRTDTHWNDRGAYAGYRAIIEAVSATFPSATADPRTRFENSSESGVGGDLARMLDADRWLHEDRLYLERLTPARARPAGSATGDRSMPQPFAMECTDPDLPRTVVFCDSFAVRLTPFLSEHFERVLYSWQMVFPTFETETIERERPRVVIQEIVERKLVLPVPNVTSSDFLASRSETWTASLLKEYR